MGGEAVDWDLFAIVRSCCTCTPTPTAANTAATFETAAATAENGNPFDCLGDLSFVDVDNFFHFPRQDQQIISSCNNVWQELQDSYKPFLPTTFGEANILGSSSISDFVGQNQPQLAQLRHQPPLPPPPPPPQPTNMPFCLQQQNLHPQGSLGSGSTTSVHSSRITPSLAPRSRKKKSSVKKKVVHVTADNLNSDEWAWRKYGQKPIKGSPYPRNYYRCSSSKGCAARKQVERSNVDPNIFIVTYSCEHAHPRPTHRNSLAGSSRTKFPAISKPAIIKESEQDPNGDQKPLCSSSSPLSATSFSPPTPLSASMDHELLAPNENFNPDAGNIDHGADSLESHGLMESDGDVDGDGDSHGNGHGHCQGHGDNESDEDILIPNLMMVDEDLIKSLKELGTIGDGAFGQTPNFGRNCFSWPADSSAAKAGAGSGR